MLKNVLNINGAQELSKNTQKTVNGGFGPTEFVESCSPGTDGLACLTPEGAHGQGICTGGHCSPNCH